MNHNSFDMYYDNPHPNRSPSAQRQLNRQPSRQQFEAPYAHLTPGLYTADDHARGYGDRFADMRNATIGGYGGAYDMGGQSWNAAAFGGNNTLNGLGGTGLRKLPSRGRAGLPSVSVHIESIPYSPWTDKYQGLARPATADAG